MRDVDVCLVNPPSHQVNPYNLAIPYLSASLKRCGFTTKVVDATALRIGPEELAERVACCRPRFVGVTVFSSIRVRPARQAIAAIRRRLPDAAVVCGGIMATLCPEEFAPVCDLVVTGPGERVLVDIVKTYPRPEVFGLPGVAWHDGENERLVVNPPEYPDDLDALPFPDWDGVLEDLSLEEVFFYNEISNRRELAVPALTSRGCPFRCAFCSNWILGAKQVRRRSAENVVRELAQVKERLGISLFHFCDDNFGYYPRHVEGICDGIVGADLDIRWRCTISANAASREATVRSLARAGCVRAMIGVESGDPEILRRINKPIPIADVERGVTLLKEAGIPVTTSFIIGLPGDTEQSVLRSMELAVKLRPSDLLVWSANPLPKTEMREMAAEEGGLLESDDIFDPSPPPVRYVTPGLRGWDLMRLTILFYACWASHDFTRAARFLVFRLHWMGLPVGYRMKLTAAMLRVMLGLLARRALGRPLRFPRWARDRRSG